MNRPTARSVHLTAPTRLTIALVTLIASLSWASPARATRGSDDWGIPMAMGVGALLPTALVAALVHAWLQRRARRRGSALGRYWASWLGCFLGACFSIPILVVLEKVLPIWVFHRDRFGFESRFKAVFVLVLLVMTAGAMAGYSASAAWSARRARSGRPPSRPA